MNDRIEYLPLLNKIIPVKDLNWWVKNKPKALEAIEKSLLKNCNKNLDNTK